MNKKSLQILWEKFLDERYCVANEDGNRPCDMGIHCDRCEFNDKEWEDYQRKAGSNE